MRVSKELKTEIEDKLQELNFKRRQANGIDVFSNSAIKEGIELNGMLISPFVVVNGDKKFGHELVGNETRLAVATIREVLGLSGEDNDQDPMPVQDPPDIAPIPESHGSDHITGVIPQYLTDEIIAKHPGTIPVLISMQRTDPNQIKERKGPSGKMLKYVEASYMVTALNYACLMDWDHEVLETRTDTIEDKLHISVLGTLTIRTTDGKTIQKTQWGSQVLKQKSEMGDALKAATSDSLKKCASYFGIAMDVYSGSV